MHTDRCHICTDTHSGTGHIITEIEVSAVSLVNKDFHACGMGDFNNFGKIGTYTVISWVVDDNSLCIGVLFNGTLNGINGHSERNAELFIDTRIDINRHCTAHDKGIDTASVDITGHNDFISTLADTHNHCLHGTGSTAYHEESVFCTESVSHEFFSFFDDADRVTEIIKRFHGIYINTHALFAEKFR